MLKAEESAEFIKSQVPEIWGLEKLGVFKYCQMSQLPPKARLLSSIWSYKRKRRPNGDLLKHKSRICVDRSQQEHGHDYWETYAPVVSWSTVRLVMLLSTILGLKSRQVDYTQAFPQAELTDPVFMGIPQGWYIGADGTLQQHQDGRYNDTSHYIQLQKNLYGCKQAARNWFQHLNQGLLAEGFVQSKIDSCLYMRGDCLMVVYTDDCLIFAKEASVIVDLIANLAKTFQLEDQGAVNDFLGVRIQKTNTTGQFSITQPGLIESIIKVVGLGESSNMKSTPADGILHPDPNGAPREDVWNFRSVIGKLNFLRRIRVLI